MRTIHGPKTRAQLRYRRHLRVRRKVNGTAERPRLVVYRSLKHIYAQLVDKVGPSNVIPVAHRPHRVRRALA